MRVEPFTDRLNAAPDYVQKESPPAAVEPDGAWDPEVTPIGCDDGRVAIADSVVDDGRGVGLGDFYAYMPSHQYIFTPSRQFWPSVSVNSRIPPITLQNRAGEPILDDKGKPKMISASAWLDREKPVEQMTWSPGDPMVVKDCLVSEGGSINRPGCSCFNLYLPPDVAPGDPAQARRWIEHVARV